MAWNNNCKRDSQGSEIVIPKVRNPNGLTAKYGPGKTNTIQKHIELPSQKPGATSLLNRDWGVTRTALEIPKVNPAPKPPTGVQGLPTLPTMDAVIRGEK